MVLERLYCRIFTISSTSICATLASYISEFLLWFVRLNTGCPKSQYTLLINSYKLHKKLSLFIFLVSTKESLQFYLLDLPSRSNALKTSCIPPHKRLHFRQPSATFRRRRLRRFAASLPRPRCRPCRFFPQAVTGHGA